MLHITCDICGKELRPGDDQRCVVRIEVYTPQQSALLTEDDLDEDHMEAVGQLLREMEENLTETDVEPLHRKLRYDLCPHCRDKFVRDPLGKETAQSFDFSEN